MKTLQETMVVTVSEVEKALVSERSSSGCQKGEPLSGNSRTLQRASANHQVMRSVRKRENEISSRTCFLKMSSFPSCWRNSAARPHSSK